MQGVLRARPPKTQSPAQVVHQNGLAASKKCDAWGQPQISFWKEAWAVRWFSCAASDKKPMSSKKQQHLWSSVVRGARNRCVTGVAAPTDSQLLVCVILYHLWGSPVLDQASMLPRPRIDQLRLLRSPPSHQLPTPLPAGWGERHVVSKTMPQCTSFLFLMKGKQTFRFPLIQLHNGWQQALPPHRYRTGFYMSKYWSCFS